MIKTASLRYQEQQLNQGVADHHLRRRQALVLAEDQIIALRASLVVRFAVNFYSNLSVC